LVFVKKSYFKFEVFNYLKQYYQFIVETEQHV